MSIPFTYLIGWSEHNKWYYGVRYSSKAHPSDLWTRYHTSSHEVKRLRKVWGEPDVIQVRKTFDDPQKARLYEHRVLKKLGIQTNDKWINKCLGMGGPSMPGALNPMANPAHRETARRRRLEVTRAPGYINPTPNAMRKFSRRPITVEQQAKMQAGAKQSRLRNPWRVFAGPHSEESKEKMRQKALGKKHTEETRAKLRAIRAANPVYSRLTDEQKAARNRKISESRRGKKYPRT